ncbi:hypothetical protein L2E82_30792 [Cichorium intybus]|uniref:Uncharacterized protein n=1 Tax=Cichorium intybus TaxID=13427 RepID=A0ACB9D1A1_CICIN|nr:hypothetical protein L2E82_30792 [Cichorium intybus]
MKSSIPTSFAMELAVPQLSPVTTKLLIFMDSRIEMTSCAPGFNGSEMARMPVSWSSMETRIPVWAKHRHRHQVFGVRMMALTNGFHRSAFVFVFATHHHRHRHLLLVDLKGGI